MHDDLEKWFWLELKETFNLVRDWRLYAAMGIVLTAAFVVDLMGHGLGLWDLALLAGVGWS